MSIRNEEKKGIKEEIIKSRRSGLTMAILSLSLLTVMAGAAVAPVLNVISEYFDDVNRTLIQMIVSVPSLFIVITNLIFPALARKYRAKSLLMVGLLLYTAGGCVAGVFNNIWMLLAARALVGIGVGIIMPMSTGLIAFYYTRDKQEKLMGYSSAMNQLGGSVATLLSGLLAILSWRAAFLVYLMGVISIVLCGIRLPNEYIGDRHAPGEDNKAGQGNFRKYYRYIIAMLLLTFAFFIYPVNFAIEAAKAGALSQTAIAVIMALMDICGFFGGLAFAGVKKRAGKYTRFVSPVLFIAGYISLAVCDHLIATLIGTCLIGFAAGEGIPFIISSASIKAGRNAGSTVLPLVSASLYTAQFLTPFVTGALGGVFTSVYHLPYWIAICFSAIFLLWSAGIRD